MSTLYASFHGGSSPTSVNTLLGLTPSSAPRSMLTPRADGVLPALSELRGLTTDHAGTLYVVNAYKEFSQILTFACLKRREAAWPPVLKRHGLRGKNANVPRRD